MRTLCYSHGCMSGAMLNTRVLDGRRISQEIQQELRPRIDALRAKCRAPTLAVVLVGNDPASQIYVRNKIKTSQELGIRSLDATPPDSITNKELLALIQSFNIDPEVDAILVQTPLPKQVNAEKVVLAVDPSKDADA